MGVYVPKMKMPEYCLLCPFEHLMTCSREERYTDIHARRRPDWCPLRELDLPDEKDFAEKLPSAHQEIIRCKDCKHRDEENFCEGRGWLMQLVPDDGFCDKGERSEE